MSEIKRDPLDIVINGEWARAEDIEYVQELAQQILDRQYAQYNTSFRYELDLGDEHPSLTIKQQMHEEEASSGSVICIELGDPNDEEPRFSVLFGYKNEIYDIFVVEDDEIDPLIEAFNIADMLLTAGALDEAGMRIGVQLKKIIESMKGVRELTSYGLMDNGQHIADLAREIIDRSTTHVMEVKEYGMPLPGERTLSIISQQAICIVPEMESPEYCLLQISYEDRASGQKWNFYSPKDGIPTLQVSMLNEDESMDYTDEEMQDEELEKMIDKLLPAKITDHDIALLAYQLMEAEAIEAAYDSHAASVGHSETQTN